MSFEITVKCKSFNGNITRKDLLQRSQEKGLSQNGLLSYAQLNDFFAHQIYCKYRKKKALYPRMDQPSTCAELSDFFLQIIYYIYKLHKKKAFHL